MSVVSGLGCLCTAGTVLAWRLDSGRVCPEGELRAGRAFESCCTGSTVLHGAPSHSRLKGIS